jgi:hypothetical protein
MDGGMVPLVEFADSSGDRRKNRKVLWAENRLCLAYAQGTINPLYGTTMGTVDEAGKEFANVIKLAGEHEKTKIHIVCDGAPWIAEQVEKNHGSKATFLLDFFHLSQYLYAAAQCCNSIDPTGWAEFNLKCMKENLWSIVLRDLENHLNEQKHFDNSCPAYKCYQYMAKRLNQLNYKEAIDQDLPIGSGEIESGHRSVIQKRLKLPGAWWLRPNASAMAKLRVLRANGLWLNYWNAHKENEFTSQY